MSISRLLRKADALLGKVLELRKCAAESLQSSITRFPVQRATSFFNPLLCVDAAGRLNVGLGIGWSEDEYEAVGVPFKQRGRRGDEFLRCLNMIWTKDIIEFQGEFYRVPRCQVEPKPVQKPRPPITIGGYGPKVIKRAVELGDGFSGGNVPLTTVEPLVREVRDAASALGKDPNLLHIVCRGNYRVYDTSQGKDRRPLWGTLDEIREDIRRYADAGLTELFLEANFIPGGDLDKLLEVMARLAPSH
jgi:alkanesulfonate monooxygenase SsuD/methylene tetrahydromethanopterin reductase-like flavin-dependent oxidoreductase (luciferase family)